MLLDSILGSLHQTIRISDTNISFRITGLSGYEAPARRERASALGFSCSVAWKSCASADADSSRIAIGKAKKFSVLVNNLKLEDIFSSRYFWHLSVKTRALEAVKIKLIFCVVFCVLKFVKTSKFLVGKIQDLATSKAIIKLFDKIWEKKCLILCVCETVKEAEKFWV